MNLNVNKDKQVYLLTIMPVKQIARKFHTLDLALSTGGLYVGGLIDIGYGPQRHGEGTRYYKDRETIAYEGSYKYGRWDGYGKRFPDYPQFLWQQGDLVCASGNYTIQGSHILL